VVHPNGTDINCELFLPHQEAQSLQTTVKQ
jgi:hypothetical protein